jgi:ribonucleoside-diphosphate reductase alpha chain
MFLDETACNLASINLDKFYDAKNRYFDVEKYKHTIRLWTIVLEISVLMAQLPSDTMAERTFLYRTLGLGYANLGTVLMKAGVPYDSPTAMNITASLTAIMTGESYSASSEMAKVLGSFERYEANKEHMLKVIRNHKRAAYNVSDSLRVKNESLFKELGDYEGLTIKPIGIDDNFVPEYLAKAAREAWDKALDFGEVYGYRNAQVTVIAPTGTIGLVMDCDTTGIEPDFALVKFKKLVGGSIKIINKSVVPALTNLGYSKSEIDDIQTYCLGTGKFPDGSNFKLINVSDLIAAGLSDIEIEGLQQEAQKAFDIRHILPDKLIKYLQKSQRNNQELIEETNKYICGAKTVEGSPHLREEHYSIFDCAICFLLGFWIIQK